MSDIFDYTAFFDSSYSGGARWYDQKVTYDNLSEVADAVLSCTRLHPENYFTRFDLMESKSLDTVVQREYGKPSLNNKFTLNEYDKFIAQNLNTLAYSGVLYSEIKHRMRIYGLRQIDILRRIAGNEKECRLFLIQYLEWVLRKFQWWPNIQRYVSSDHTQEDIVILKKSFNKLLIDTMGLGSKGSKHTETESARIFSKVINLIAYAKMVPGIERGHVMEFPPSTYELSYNRPNWRDTSSKKPKNVARKQYASQMEAESNNYINSRLLSREMRIVKSYQNQIAEVPDASGIKASHIHHIFPKHDFPELQDIRENLIALTPGQHLGQAHPNGNTQRIDPIFQRTCLFHKLQTIRHSVEAHDGMYSYRNFAKVLSIGWGIDEVDSTYQALLGAIVHHIS